MNNWKNITEIQKKEILFSKGGLGFQNAKIATVVYVIMALLQVLFLLGWSVVAWVKPNEYAQISKFDIMIAVMLIWALLMLWIMTTGIVYWVPLLIRWFRINKKEVTYQYCMKKGEIVGKYGFMQCVAILDDGTEVQGKLEIMDLKGTSVIPSKNMIAYKVEGSEKIYFSHIMPEKKKSNMDGE